MATFYLDPELGSDAANGTSFALAWQTVTAGPTAARIAPGDIVRVKASPLPTSLGINATFTDKSDTVTLASALTANIETCEAAWTAAANVTASTTTTEKEGSAAITLAIADAFGTGIVGYKDLGGTFDFSAYEQVSFWIWKTSGAALHASNVFELRLCSDAVGAVPVDTIVIPAFGSTSKGHCFTVGRTGGGALGNAIQSISIAANSDPGVVTVVLDNILACKASSSADSLSLTSLIGKNAVGDTCWYAIRSINGTTVKLDQMGGTFTNITCKGYVGTTETVTAWKRECFRPTAAITAGAVSMAVQDSGTEGSNITFSGGWDRTDMSTQLTGEDGQSWFDGINNIQFGFGFNAQNFIAVDRLSMVRYDYGFYVISGNSHFLTNCNSICNQRAGIGGAGTNLQVSDGYFCQNGQAGIVSSSGQNLLLNNLTLNSQGVGGGQGSGITLTNTSEVVARNIVAKNNDIYAINASRATLAVFGLTTTDSGTAAISNSGTKIDLFNWSASEATEVVHQLSYSNWRVTSSKHDGSVDNHKTFIDGALISSETGANRRTASDIAWSVAPISTVRSASNPAILHLTQFAVDASSLVTVKVWVNRSNAAVTAKLVCRAHQIAGVSTDVTTTAAGAAGSYEELTITFTPTEAGVVDIEAHVYGGTTHTVYFDDMTITQA